MIKLAIDSKPLSLNYFCSTDYSGLQLNGLSYLTLAQALQEIFTLDNQTWKIYLKDFFWQSGRPITSNDFLFGIIHLFKINPFVMKTYFSDLKKISVQKDVLVFDFKVPINYFEQIIRHPHIVALNERECFGYSVKQETEKKWNLLRKNRVSGQVLLVENPKENCDLFMNYKLDTTADTAIDLNQFNDTDNQISDTGLFGCLVFTKNIDILKVNFLLSDLSRLDFSEKIEKCFPKIKLIKKITNNSNIEKKLLVGFDKFYPNEIIALEIKSHLEAEGWNVNLVEDDFYNPSLKCDVKFMILRPVANNNFYKCWSLYGFYRSTLNLGVVSKYVSNNKDQCSFDYNAITDLKLGFPLFKIPSCYKSRLTTENPLIRGLK